MFRPLISRFLRKLARPTILSGARMSAPRRFRPALESLDERVVPTLYVWVGGDSAYPYDPAVAVNWLKPPHAPSLPDFDDDIEFNQTSSVSCVGLGGSFQSVHILDGYYGTVSLGGSLTAGRLVNGVYVGGYEQTGGSLAQDNGENLTVTGSFTWSGGVLNSTPSTAFVNINGGGAITLGGGVLNAGSTLSFGSTGGEKTTTIGGGGTLLLNGTSPDAIFVRNNGKVELPVQVGSPNAVKGVDNVAKTLTIEPNGYWGYTGSGTGDLGLKVQNVGGKFLLNGQVTIKVRAGFNAVVYNQSGANNNSAILEIQNGSVLDTDTTAGVAIHGGTVWLNGNSALPAVAQKAIIRGTYTMTNGVIGFMTPTVTSDGFLSWGAFDVVGNVNWSGGQYNPGLNCAPSAPANDGNQWRIVGTLTIDATGAIKPTISPIPQLLPPGQQASGTWDVISATKVEGGNPSIIPGWILLPVVIANGTTTGYRVNK